MCFAVQYKDIFNRTQSCKEILIICRSYEKDRVFSRTNPVETEQRIFEKHLVDKNFQMEDLFDSSIKLTDDQSVRHCYKPAAVLVVSRYSDSGNVIKREAGVFVQYSGDTYSKSTPLSSSKMADLFDTCGAVLVFHYKVSTDATQSPQMSIVSQHVINGEKRVIIKDGDRFFAITTKQAATAAKDDN